MAQVSFYKDNWPNIITVVIVLLTMIITFQIFKIDFNPVKDKEIKKIVTVETFKIKLPECEKRSVEGCKSSPDCVLLDGSKCVAGTAYGPTVLVEDGKNVEYNYYFHKHECFGKNCP